MKGSNRMMTVPLPLPLRHNRIEWLFDAKAKNPNAKIVDKSSRGIGSSSFIHHIDTPYSKIEATLVHGSICQHKVIFCKEWKLLAAIIDFLSGFDGSYECSLFQTMGYQNRGISMIDESVPTVMITQTIALDDSTRYQQSSPSLTL